MGKRRGAGDGGGAAVAEPEPEATAPALALDLNYDDEAAEGLASIEPRDLTGRLERIELEHILDSPTQPRKSYDDAYLRELAESIARTGLQQPPVVRELTDGRVELVVGHCRTRAARLAGLHEIDVIVRDMTDEQVAVAQLAENMQRQDLTPIDEAEALQRLVALSSARDVARDLGISVASVYARLKLCALVPAARDLLAAKTLSPSVALLLARVPAELQLDALEVVVPQWNGGVEVSVRDAAGFIAKYLRRLPDAPWRLEDAELVPEAGPCSTCPHRSSDESDRGAAGKQRLCLEPDCYDRKMAAHNAQRVADARAGGATVLEGEAASKALESQRYVEASEHAPYIPAVKARTWGEVAARVAKAGDKVRPPVLALDSEGRLRELHERKYLERSLDRLTAAAQADVKAKGGGGGQDAALVRAAEREREAERAEQRARRARAEAALVERATKATPATPGQSWLLLELLSEQGFVPPSDVGWSDKVSPSQAVVWGLVLFALDRQALLEAADADDVLERVCRVLGVDPSAEPAATRPSKRPATKAKGKARAKGKR